MLAFSVDVRHEEQQRVQQVIILVASSEHHHASAFVPLCQERLEAAED